MYSHKRSAWIRLNGPGVMIGLLELFICLFFILDPHQTGVLAWAAHIGMGLAGLGLLHAYATRSVVREMIAWLLIAISNLLDFAVEVATTTPPTFNVRSATLQLIILAGVGLRVSALLEGGTYVVPRWSREHRR